jgi:type I restriction enzyme S subunit
MGGEWRLERFVQMAVLVRDTVHPSDAPQLPYIGLEHIGEGTLGLLGTGIAEDAISLKVRFRAGDVLFGKLRPYFRKVIRAPFDGICSTDIWVVRPKPGIDAGFLFYLMASSLFLEPVVRASEGTKMPRAKWEYATSLELPLPPLPEQRAIAHILGTLDDKIKLNRKQNETLEAMARALFKAWFVDFEPVRAKIEGRWQRGQSRPGLPAHLYDLFPDRLVESELGEIPEGWRIFSFGDVAHQAKGTVNPSAASHETFTHYSLPAFDAGQIPNTESGDAIKSNKTPVPNSAVLISKLNPHIPRIWLIGKAGKNAVCSTEFIAWVPKAPANSSFLYCLASSPEFNSAMQQLVTGTSNSHQRVKPEQLRDIRVFAASQKAIEAFSDVVSCLMDQVLENRQQSRTLAQLRDTLLPKLISGELRVTEAMLQIEGASA